MFAKFLEQRQAFQIFPLGCPSNATKRLQLRFEFVIPHQLISPHSDVDLAYLNLLPTVKEGPKFQEKRVGPTFMRPMIFYHITGSANTGENMSQCMREIKVLPSIPALPPLQVVHFPREYKTECRKELKRYIWSSPLGKLTVSAEEPQPLNLSCTAPRASTLATVSFSFDSSKPHTSMAPPDSTVMVRYLLRSRTFYTTEPLAGMPNLDTIESNPLIQMTTETTRPEVRQFNKLSWRLHPNSSAEPGVSNDSTLLWTTTLTVSINASKNLTPTFLNPLSAHRYALVMQITIPSWCSQTLALEVPIQVIHYSYKGGYWKNSVSDVTEDCIDSLNSDGNKPPGFEESCAFDALREAELPPYRRR